MLSCPGRAAAPLRCCAAPGPTPHTLHPLKHGPGSAAHRRRGAALRRGARELMLSMAPASTMVAAPKPESMPMTQPAERFPAPPLDTLPDDIRTRLRAVQEKSGFVPNVFLTLAYRPDEFRAFFA